MTVCGLCGQSTRHIGSHVINEHCAYAAGQDAITNQLRAEIMARAQRDKAPLPYQSPSTRRALAGELPGKVLR